MSAGRPTATWQALWDGQPSGLLPRPSLFKVPCVRWRPVDGAGKQVLNFWEGPCMRSEQPRSCLVVVSWPVGREQGGGPVGHWRPSY